jgi:hypothetical protein
MALGAQPVLWSIKEDCFQLRVLIYPLDLDRNIHLAERKSLRFEDAYLASRDSGRTYSERKIQLDLSRRKIYRVHLSEQL